MSTPKVVWPGSQVATPSEVPHELGAAEDRTSKVEPALFAELAPLPVDPVDTAQAALPGVPRPPATAVSMNGGRADDLIGKYCGGYVIEAVLGEGGMGKVYLASNVRLGRRAAVKVLRAQHSFRSDIVYRFLQEARAAALIDDPNIIDVFDANELGDGRAYLLMPYVEGESLEDLCVRKGPMAFDVAATILFQICSGLNAAHQNSIVHRDIKPPNILVGRRQHREHFVRIVDFGIAKLLDPDSARKVETHSMAVLGTPGYMAPEQARGERKIDSRADVYAVGVVAYRMVTGRLPYTEESLFELIGKHATNAPFPRPISLRPDLPIEWDAAIMAALANQRDDRLPSVRELALRLARGIPEGEQMLRMLAPRLAESPLPPSARTLDPFLDHDIARRTGSQRHQSEQLYRQRPGGALPRRWVLGAAAFALLFVGGLLGLVLASVSSPTATQGEPASQQSARVPSPPPAAPPPVPSAEPVSRAPSTASTATTGAPAPPKIDQSAQGTEEKAVVASKASQPETNGSSASDEERMAHAARPVPKLPSKVLRTPAAQPSAPAVSGPRAANSQLPPDDAASLARLGVGVLVVKVQPWGILTINGVQEGYAPKRKEMPAGQYVIHIASKGDKSEVLKVTVTPGKVTTVERKYQ
jgi:serine/threonine protein kinase